MNIPARVLPISVYLVKRLFIPLNATPLCVPDKHVTRRENGVLNLASEKYTSYARQAELGEMRFVCRREPVIFVFKRLWEITSADAGLRQVVTYDLREFSLVGAHGRIDRLTADGQ